MDSHTRERRRHIRIPLQAPCRWTSGNDEGSCVILDVSPGGGSFAVESDCAGRIGPRVRLDVLLQSGLEWCLSPNAKVIRRESHEGGLCKMAVRYPAYGWEEEESDA